jgi:hypothetical protein
MPTREQLNLAEQVQGILPVANGGTGASTLSGVLVGSGTGAITAASPLGVANGGTGVTSLASGQLVVGLGTSAVTSVAYNSIPTASNVAQWDGNANMNADAFISTATSTATAASTTTLSITSSEVQVFTGTQAQTVKLPTTSVPAGMDYTIINQSTGNVTVQSSGGNTIVVLAQNQIGFFISLQSTPTTNAHWNADVITAGKAVMFDNTMTFQGTDGYTYTFPALSDTVDTISSTATLTNKSISGSANTLTSIPNSALTNSQVTIGSTAVSLGGTAASIAGLTLTNPTVTDYTETLYANTESTAYTPALTNGTVHKILLTSGSNLVVTMPAITSGVSQSFILMIRQPASGTTTNTVVFTGGTAPLWPGGTAPTMSTGANAMDIYSFYSDGTNWYGSYVQNYTY